MPCLSLYVLIFFLRHCLSVNQELGWWQVPVILLPLLPALCVTPTSTDTSDTQAKTLLPTKPSAPQEPEKIKQDTYVNGTQKRGLGT